MITNSSGLFRQMSRMETMETIIYAIPPTPPAMSNMYKNKKHAKINTTNDRFNIFRSEYEFAYKLAPIGPENKNKNHHLIRSPRVRTSHAANIGKHNKLHIAVTTKRLEKIDQAITP
jgi:hypothetical protein